jgi:hypothetical protein
MRLSLLWFVGLALLFGCAGDKAGSHKDKGKGGPRREAANDKAAPEAAQAPAVAGGKQPQGGERAPQKDKKAQPRLIIYTGQVELIVADFEEARVKMMAALKEQDGYVSGSEVTGQPGEPRYGRWTLRIPVAKFETFLDELARLGELRRQTLDSEDVTDRYFDTKAEVANLEARQEALRKLYQEKIGGSKLTDLLEVDRELSNVSGQINLRKGQLQRWEKLVEFATITLTLRDRRGYVPPESPDFGTTVGRTFHSSIDALVSTGKGIVLVAVAVGPWLGVLLVLFAAVWFPVRYFTRRSRSRIPPPPLDVIPVSSEESDHVQP